MLNPWPTIHSDPAGCQASPAKRPCWQDCENKLHGERINGDVWSNSATLTGLVMVGSRDIDKKSCVFSSEIYRGSCYLFNSSTAITCHCHHRCEPDLCRSRAQWLRIHHAVQAWRPRHVAGSLSNLGLQAKKCAYSLRLRFMYAEHAVSGYRLSLSLCLELFGNRHRRTRRFWFWLAHSISSTFFA